MGGHEKGKKNGQAGRSVDLVHKKCSGYAQQRVGLELMNRCKLEKVSTKENGKMLKRIQIFENGRIPAMEARNWKIEGQKRRITRREYRRLWSEFEMGGFMAQEGLWNVAKEKCWKTGVHYPKKTEIK